MIDFCHLCQATKDHNNWKAYFDIIDGKHQLIHICGEHYNPIPYEFTTAEIKEDRKKYFKDIIQPYRGNELSREFVDAYPKQAQKMIKDPERLKKARDVWKDQPGYNNFRTIHPLT